MTNFTTSYQLSNPKYGGSMRNEQSFCPPKIQKTLVDRYARYVWTGKLGKWRVTFFPREGGFIGTIIYLQFEQPWFSIIISRYQYPIRSIIIIIHVIKISRYQCTIISTYQLYLIIIPNKIRIHQLETTIHVHCRGQEPQFGTPLLSRKFHRLQQRDHRRTNAQIKDWWFQHHVVSTTPVLNKYYFISRITMSIYI